MKKMFLGLLSLSLVFVLSSCGDTNSFTDEGDQVAAAMASSAAFDVAEGASIASNIEALANEADLGEVDCPKGGTVKMAVTGGTTTSGTVTYTFSDCKFEIPASDIAELCSDQTEALLVTVDGDLDVESSLSGTSISRHYTGSVSVKAGKLDGTCTYDITEDGDDATGTICGYDVSKIGEEPTPAQAEQICKAVF